MFAFKDKESVKLNVRLQYPRSNEFEYFTKLDTIDLDKECENDINSGDGFMITDPLSNIKKDIKNMNGIYSPRFGPKLGDINPFADRYRCYCGETTGRINNGLTCKYCGQKVKYVDDNFKKFGWIILKEQYHIINPRFYDTLDYIFGSSKYGVDRKKQKATAKQKRIAKPSKLKNMLNYSPEVDQHGVISPCTFKPEDEPFYGIGMMEFYERFDEILDYYAAKNPKKKDYVQDVRDSRDMVFCHSIPVYTTHLRPIDVRNDEMYFDPANGLYNMINKHVSRINKDRRHMDRNVKIKNSELFKLQMKFMELCDEVLSALSGKYGNLRMLIGGRYNYSSRSVIRQDPTLRIDQIKLPYVTLVKVLQQRIINILIRTYNMTPSEAQQKWSNALVNFDERIGEIIDMIIKSNGEGLPVILNRNPTIDYGSVLQMFCIGYTKTLTISVPLQVLKPLGADFDGDVLNVFIIINKAFFERAYVVFNPRNAMYISRIDGKLNKDVLVQRDTLINANTLLHLGRNRYTKEQRTKIDAIRKKQKELYHF